MSYVLAIDLGTSNVAAAVLREGERQAIIVELSDRVATMPSTVYLQPDGAFVVGEAAERRARIDPERVARGFKRRLGDPVPLLLGGTPVGPAALLASLARHVISTVQQREGSAAARVALTHPANWGDWKREQLRQVAVLCELDDVVFVSEPEAAAVHFAHRDRVASGEIVAVYDLGGGTFDATVLRNTGAGYHVLGDPVGIEQLGGIDFDEALLAHVLRLEGVAPGTLDGADPNLQRQMQLLRAQCEAAKELLTVETEAVVGVELGNRRSDVRVTRREFEALIEPAIALTIEHLSRAVHNAGVDLTALSHVVLAGGSSRIPLVGELVARHTGRPTAVDSHPKHAVALGAALIAGEQVLDQQAPAPPPAPPTPGVGAAPPGGDGSASMPPPLVGTGVASPGGPPAATSAAAAPPPASQRPVGPPGPHGPTAFVPTPQPKRSGGQRWPFFAALIGVLGLIAGAAAILLARGSDAGATEVFAEPAASPGPNPFTPSTASPAPSTSTTVPPTSTSRSTTATTGLVPSKSGDLAGLYGGSLNLAVCDKPKLVGYLSVNEPKARAWAAAQGITPAQITDFVASLTPVVLRDDARVTNNGFDEARAAPTPRQSILERGTAVLVDTLGQPRVRCYCGNPLGAPEPVRQKLVGQPWPGLEPTQVIRIVAAAQPLTEFIVIDVSSGVPVTIPAAPSAPPSTTSTPSTPPANTTVPTTAVTTPTSRPPIATAPSTTTAASAVVDLTTLGTPSASSTFGGGTYPPFLAVDGDPTTSWFSAGPQNGFSSYSLRLPATRTVTHLTLGSNAANRNPQFRQNYGFGAVTVDVLDHGVATFSRQFDLSGTPDPDLDIELTAAGDEILLTFSGSEDRNCGGFAELTVLGR